MIHGVRRIFQLRRRKQNGGLEAGNHNTVEAAARGRVTAAEMTADRQNREMFRGNKGQDVGTGHGS